MGRLRWIVIVVSSMVVLAGCDWAQFGGSPGHTAADPVDQQLNVAAGSHLATAWSTACACLAPLDSNGIVYVADGYDGNAPRDVTLRALDDATGTTRWSLTLHHVLNADFLAIGNGLAYVSVALSGPTESDPQPGSDLLVALDASTGAGRWLIVPPAAASGISTIGDAVMDASRLFVRTYVGNANELSAIDTGGHVLWSTASAGTFDDMVGDGTTLYVRSHTTSASYVRYAEATGGASSPIALASSAGPLRAANGLLYTGPQALHPDTGVEAWHATGENVAAVSFSVAVMSAGADLVGRNSTTGGFLWRATGANSSTAGESGPVIGGSLVLSGHPNVVGVVSLDDGSALGATPAVGLDVSVIASNGHVFVDGANTLYAFAPTS